MRPHAPTNAPPMLGTCQLRFSSLLYRLSSPTEPMLEQPIGKIGHAGTSTAETATVSSSVNTPNTSSVTECTVNKTPVNNHNTHPTHVNNPSSLYDILSPLLLHQHSTLTSLQHILNPLLHLQTIPTRSLQQLHQLLESHSHANIHLPPYRREAALVGPP